MAYQQVYPNQGPMNPQFVRTVVAARDARIAALEYELYCASQLLYTQNTDILQLRQRIMELELHAAPFVAAPFVEPPRRDPPAPPARPAPLFVAVADPVVAPVVAPVDPPLPIFVEGDDAAAAVAAVQEAPRRTRATSKQMRDCFDDGDIVRHFIPSLNSTWDGVYDEETETIQYQGIDYKSISGFTKAHYRVALNDPSTTKGGNGWKECVIVRNGVETPASEVDRS